MQDLKILALQADLFWEDPVKNRFEFSSRIEKNFDSHNLIILPETFTTGFPVDPQYYSETLDGETIIWMRSMASKYNAVITGTILIKTGDSYANTLIWMRPDGVMDKYEKRHLFSMGGEHEKIVAGQESIIIDLMGWKIRPLICYDLRFPVWSKNTYDGNFEYDLAIYLANWPAARSFPWKTLLLARAIENQSFVIGLNRVGIDGPGNKYSGDSMIIDPLGNILAKGNENIDEAITTTLEYEKLLKFRKNFNVGPDWDKFIIA